MVEIWWGTGNEIGSVYVVKKSRLGSNDRQPREGSLAICARHSGDCFFDYVPLRIDYGKRTMNGLPKREFGAYAFSEEAKVKLSPRRFHLLMAGETVRF